MKLPMADPCTRSGYRPTAFVGTGGSYGQWFGRGAESVLTPGRPTRRLAAETASRSTITQIYEGTNQIQRMVMAR
jgi:hypothetical protein